MYGGFSYPSLEGIAMLTTRAQSAHVPHVSSRARLLALAAGLVAGVASTSHAQTRVWNQTNSTWGTVGNWSPANVPDDGVEIAELGGIAAYVVDTTTNYSIGGLNFTNPLATLRTAPGTTFSLNGPSTNNGTLLVNSTGTNTTTVLSINSSHTISGTGSIVMNANPLSLDSAYLYFNNGANVLTLGAGQTLRGTGNIYTNINNQGTVQADVPAATLQLLSQPKSNSGTMRGTNGGTLAISSIGITQSGGGQIVADGGTVSINSASITGGVLNAINSGVLQTVGTSTVDGSTVAGPLNVNPGAVLNIGGPGLTNNGTITVNSSSTNTATVLACNAASQTIGGTGSIVLNANSLNLDSAYLYFTNGAFVLTLGAGQTVRGTGNVYTNVTNNGVVQADITGRTLHLFNQPKTNNNIFRAINGATLVMSGATFTQGAGGVIRADGGTVSLSSCTVNNGTLASINGGVLKVDGNTRVNGAVNVNNLDVSPSSNLYLSSSPITNNGTITVNPTGANASTTINIESPTSTILGTGSIVLNANPANLDSAYMYFTNGAYVFTLPSTQTLRGTGNVYTNIINNGTIQADINARTLRLFNQPKTNNNILRAINGAELLLEGMTITQGAGGIIRADGGTVRVNSATITGGTVTAINSGALNVTGTSTFNAVTINNDVNVIPTSTLSISNAGLTNNGRIVVNPTATNSTTILSLVSPTGLIDGTGTILLNANTANADSAYLYFNNGANVLTLGPGQTLAGNGRVYTTLSMQGTIAPGTPTDSTGTLLAAGAITMSPTASLDIEIGGTSLADFDRIASTAPFNVNGLVCVTLVNGFTNPAIGTFFDVVTAPSVTGQCVNSDMPRGWGVFFVPGALRVQYTGCLADLDCGNGSGTPDGGVDINDLLYFLTQFESGTAAADLDDGSGTGTTDGGVDISDLLFFLTRFESGC